MLESNYLFDYYPARKKILGFISIPHSGEWIPQEFRKYLTDDQTALDADVDFKVSELIDIEALNDAGIAVIVARIHRACIDLNRSSDLTLLTWKENTHGIKLVTQTPGPKETEALIEKYHTPYYRALTELVALCKQSLATPIPMIDLHSMPSKPTAYHMKLNPAQSMSRADFCVSDLKGISCRPEFINFVIDSLKNGGYFPSVNDPYFGGNVTKFINSIDGTDNIQIEISRAIYMDEEKHQLIPSKVARLVPALHQTFIDTFLKFGRAL